MGSNLYAQPGLLMFWSHDCLAPWQTQEWVEQMRKQLRPNAFLRHVENRFVTSESNFVPIEWWNACVDAELRPELTDPHLAVWVGVDASVKRDSTAIVCCTFDQAAKKVRLVWHRTFQPSPEDPLDFENTIERTLTRAQTPLLATRGAVMTRTKCRRAHSGSPPRASQCWNFRSQCRI